MKYRALWAMATFGLLVHFVGLGWDVYRHSADSTLAEHEDVLSLANPSHLMIVLGMAIVAASLLGMAAIWMNDRRFGGSGIAGSFVRGVSLPLISMAAAGSIWLASTAEDSGHEHAHADGATDHVHEAAGPGTQEALAFLLVKGSPASTASADGHVHATTTTAPGGTEVLDEGSSHTHGNEVSVTSEQLIAAAQFSQEVTASTRKYTDVRDALADGYVQITQDLPGIAAHFIKSSYQHDGHELDPEYPEVLLYTKRLDGSWKLIGVMFMAETVSDTPPSYFGALDVWHRHENLCFTAGAQVRTTASAAECRGGLFVKSTAYQMHVWTEPGGTGVFAHDFTPISPGPFPGATRPAANDLLVQAR